MTFARDATFSLGATESSRSRNTRSAGLAAAFSIMRSLVAGVDSSHRLKRIIFPLSRRNAPFIVMAQAQGLSSLEIGKTLHCPQPGVAKDDPGWIVV